MVVIGSVSSDQNRKSDGRGGGKGGEAEAIQDIYVPIGCLGFDQPIGKEEVRGREDGGSNGEDLKDSKSEVPWRWWLKHRYHFRIE